jgi:TonB family protein
MIAAWILYALLVGVLVSAGALVLETLLRAHRVPTRWVWLGAMTLSVFWPLGHVFWRNWPKTASPTVVPEAGIVPVLDPLAVQVTQESFLRQLDAPILMVWVLSTTALLALFVLLLRRTRRMRQEWKGEEAGGHPVLFSQDLGPAVVGYMRPEIVLPGWCRELEDRTLNLILDHEMEHLRAGDLRLILTSGIFPILLPWHLPIWWQYKRLRLSAEADCDLRVLRKHPEMTRPYLELLLQVGGRPHRSPVLVAMLSEPEETLERRIRIMTMPFPKKPWIRGVLLAAVGGLLVGLACWAPSPSEVDGEPEPEAVVLPPPVDQDAASLADAEVTEGQDMAPTFTPYTIRPDILNRREVAESLEAEYPPLLRDAGIGGVVQVWIHIDESGRVARTQLNESSGHHALDEAALRVANLIEFSPAQNRGEQVAVWISLPISFTTAGGPREDQPSSPTEVDRVEEEVGVTPPATARELPPKIEISPPPTDREISAAPTFTPYTVRPDIRNRAEIARALEESYPPDLRDAGIGGTAHVWFFIDDNGVVQRALVNESSGHEALDRAALEVARRVQFTPALNRDKRVPVWISLPITFTTR